MKKVIYLLIALFLTAATSKAQTYAMDFNMNDCNGNMHHLFSELDQEKVIILEYFMTCNSCILGGHALETMQADLDAQFPGQLSFYQFAYTNSYTCATITGWHGTNQFLATPFDSGAAQVAYYGGFGMPTVAIVAGSSHRVIYSSVGFSPGDTTQAGTAIRNFFAQLLSTNELPASVTSFNTFPNPASSEMTVNFNLKEKATVTMQLLDVTGKMVMLVMSDELSAGVFEKKINTTSLAQGNYTLNATVNGTLVSRKINIVK